MNRFTLFGAYQYDPTLFDGAEVPENIDKNILIDTIMQECGELKPYYQNPAWLKHNINNWFKAMYFSFDKMMNAIKSEFSPIENYDRYEVRKTSESESAATSVSDSSSSLHSESDQHDVSAFNESGYSPADQNRIASRESGANATDSKSNRNRDYYEESHLHGNIGVTRADEMIRSTIRMYEDIYVYKLIARMFEKEFLVQVY